VSRPIASEIDRLESPSRAHSQLFARWGADRFLQSGRKDAGDLDIDLEESLISLMAGDIAGLAGR
jgi:hypothetical protein